MNKIFITGNLTRDPERGTTPAGVNWCRFSVAVRRRYKKTVNGSEVDTDFVRVTAWRGLGDTCSQYLTKGKKVAVTGYPEASAYKSREGEARATLEITAEEVEFLSPRSDGPGEAPPEEPGGYVPVDSAGAEAAFER